MKRLLPKSEFARNVLTLMSGTTIAQAIPVVISPILTRLYTPEEFGVFAIFFAVVGFLTTAATGRYEMAVMLPYRDEDSEALVVLSVWIAAMVSLLTLVIVIVFNKSITYALGDRAIGFWIYVVPVGVLLTGLYNTLNFWLNRCKRYTAMSLNRIAQSFIIGAVSIGFGYINLGAGGLILGLIVGRFVTTMTLIVQFLNRDRDDSPKQIRLEQIRRVSHRYRYHPYHLLPADLIGSAATQLPVIIVSNAFGAATVGFYSLAYRMITLPSSLVANAIGDVYRQQASVAYQEKGEFSALFLNTLFKTLKVAIFPFLILYLIAPDLFAFVFGEPWRVAGQYARIIAIEAFLQFVLKPIDKSALITGATSYIFFWQLARLILTGGLFAVAIHVKLSIESVLWALVSINSLLYVTDGVVEYRLSRLKNT